MRVAFARRLLPLLLVAAFTTPYAPVTHAQDGTPVAPPSSTTTRMTGKIIEPTALDKPGVSSSPTAAPDASPVATATTAPVPTIATSDLPTTEAQAVATGAQPCNKQGPIQLDLSSPAGVTAGGNILYTYGYTNTTGTATAPLIVEV